MNILSYLKNLLNGIRYGETYHTDTGQWTTNTPPPKLQYRPQPTQEPYSPSPTPVPQQQYAAVQPTPQQQYQAPVETENITYGRSPRALSHKPPKEVVNAIKKAAKTFGVPESLLYDIAAQESGFTPDADPYAQGRGEQYAEAGYPKGLFQITDPLWNSLINSKGTFGESLRPLLPVNPSRFDPETNALAAAYLIANGQLGRWNASQGVWGPSYSREEIDPYYSQTEPDRIPRSNWKQ